MAKRGFVLLPRRRVVKRNFTSAARFRRLALEYKQTLKGSHFIAFGILMTSKLIELATSKHPLATHDLCHIQIGMLGQSTTHGDGHTEAVKVVLIERLKTVAKWKKRESTADRRTGSSISRSTGLPVDQEAIVVAFRRHTLLLLDDRLYALQVTIPQLRHSSLHRCPERHGISRLPEGDRPRRKKFDIYPIGFFHINLTEVRTAEGKLYLFVSIEMYIEVHRP